MSNLKKRTKNVSNLTQVVVRDGNINEVLQEIVQIINENFMQLGGSFGSLVGMGADNYIIEFDSKGITNPTEFTFTNTYWTEPIITVSLQSLDTSVFTGNVTLIAKPTTLTPQGGTQYYTGVSVSVVGSFPTGSNHKVSMIAICRDKREVV